MKTKVKSEMTQVNMYFVGRILSCQHCNQARIHEMEENGNKLIGTRGKEDKFPLREVGRWISHGETLDTEENLRLLLHPCLDDPAEHFDYNDENAVPIAKTDMATASIEVYALNRTNLVKKRNLTRQSFMYLLDHLSSNILLYDSNKSSSIRDMIVKALSQIAQMTSKDAEFAGMNRFYLKKFLTQNNLHSLIGEKI